MCEYTNGHSPDLQAALDRVVSSGGKRVRPTVVLLTAGMFGADEEWGYFFSGVRSSLSRIGQVIKIVHRP